MSVSAKFAWYDLWVGAFIERNHPDYRLVVYVCPLPMLLLVFRSGRRDGFDAVTKERDELQKRDTQVLDEEYPPGTSRLEIALTEALNESEDRVAALKGELRKAQERNDERPRLWEIERSAKSLLYVIDAQDVGNTSEAWHVGVRDLRKALAASGGQA